MQGALQLVCVYAQEGLWTHSSSSLEPEVWGSACFRAVLVAGSRRGYAFWGCA